MFLLNWGCTSDRDVIPIKNDCTCNGQFCEWGKFCWEGKCQVNPKPQISLCDGESKTSEICMCEDNKCTLGQYCLEGECSNLPAACTEDEEDAITFECDCGGVHCASGFYCYDGKCNDAPKKPCKLILNFLFFCFWISCKEQKNTKFCLFSKFYNFAKSAYDSPLQNHTFWKSFLILLTNKGL